jgi:hypothetical protein
VALVSRFEIGSEIGFKIGFEMGFEIGFAVRFKGVIVDCFESGFEAV